MRTLFCFVLVIAGCGTTTLREGDTPPAELLGKRSEVVFPLSEQWLNAEPDAIWVFRAEDCLDCQRFDYDLRRARERHGADFVLVGILVGPEEPQVREFFRVRRLSPILCKVDEWQAPAALPILAVIENGRIAWISIGANNVAPPEVDLSEVLYDIPARVEALWNGG